MSTCLFPLTKDEARLEALARVPPGTAAKMRAFQAMFPKRNAIWRPGDPGIDEGQLYFDLLHGDAPSVKCPDCTNNGAWCKTCNPSGRSLRIEELFSDSVVKIADVENYENFLLFGWGRVDREALYEMGVLCDDEEGPDVQGTEGNQYAGDCTDPKRCFRALWCQGQRSNRLRSRVFWDGDPARGLAKIESGDTIVALAEGLRWG